MVITTNTENSSLLLITFFLKLIYNMIILKGEYPKCQFSV